MFFYFNKENVNKHDGPEKIREPGEINNQNNKRKNNQVKQRRV